MSITLRCLLSLVSLLSCAYTLRRIRKAQMQIDDSIFWIVLSILLVFISIFPDIAAFLSGAIGIESPANAVFLAVIFLLLAKLFGLSVQVSQLHQKIRTISQEIALMQTERKHQ